jgi:putative DNA methylase
VALTTFSRLVQEARERVRIDARAAGLPDDGRSLGAGARRAAVGMAVHRPPARRQHARA